MSQDETVPRNRRVNKQRTEIQVEQKPQNPEALCDEICDDLGGLAQRMEVDYSNFQETGNCLTGIIYRESLQQLFLQTVTLFTEFCFTFRITCS